MNAPDSSVLVAGMISTHTFNRVAIEALGKVRENGCLIGHTVAEAYSVLTAPSGLYRKAPARVVEYLDQFEIESRSVVAAPSTYRKALELLVATDRPGGVIYDTLIALTAASASLTLYTLDRRAFPVYELCGADAVLISETGA